MRRFILTLVVAGLSTALCAQGPQAVTIRAGRLLDGRGGSQQNVVVRVEGGQIVSVGKSNELTPEARTGLLNVAPPLIDFTIITASSCERYRNRRHET